MTETEFHQHAEMVVAMSQLSSGGKKPSIAIPHEEAHETGDYTMQQIADAFGVHYSTVSSAPDKTVLKNT